MYSCGTSIKFFDTETNKTETFLPEYVNNEDNLNGICLLTASTAINKFAFSETQLSPTIYIHDLQGFKQISKLSGKYDTNSILCKALISV